MVNTESFNRVSKGSELAILRRYDSFLYRSCAGFFIAKTIATLLSLLSNCLGHCCLLIHIHKSRSFQSHKTSINEDRSQCEAMHRLSSPKEQATPELSLLPIAQQRRPSLLAPALHSWIAAGAGAVRAATVWFTTVDVFPKPPTGLHSAYPR